MLKLLPHDFTLKCNNVASKLIKAPFIICSKLFSGFISVHDSALAHNYSSAESNIAISAAWDARQNPFCFASKACIINEGFSILIFMVRHF